MTKKELEKLSKRTVGDILKHGEGTPYQANIAFAALAMAVGFDARMALLPDRGDIFFEKRRQTRYFLSAYDVAVNVAGKWRFYDVADSTLPIGALRWQEEGVDAFIPDSREPLFVRTAVTPAERSKVTRVAEFTLNENGDLEGNVKQFLSGHEARQWRLQFASASHAEQEDSLRKDLQGRFPSAQLTNVTFANPEDLSNPVNVSYHIKVIGYAQRTGKRLFFTPAYFEQGTQARFLEPKRELPVYFHYPWSEQDEIRIKLPEHYLLDHGDSPGGFKFPVGEYRLKIGLTPDGTTLIYERGLIFDSKDLLLFAPQKYHAVKQLFDMIHENDGHQLTIKVQTQPFTSGSK